MGLENGARLNIAWKLERFFFFGTGTIQFRLQWLPSRYLYFGFS
jgi:hypothetical protein